MRSWARRLLVLVGLLLAAAGIARAQPAPQLVQLGAPHLWQRLEFSIGNVPPLTNPFDPNVISVDLAFVLPSGKTNLVPAFWYQNYQRNLSGNSESLTLFGSPEWRARFTPPEPGSYMVVLTVRTNGQPYGSPVSTSFNVPVTSTQAGSGYVGLGPGRQYLQTSDGEPLRLIGENVCWPGSRGTYDYDDWFAAMQTAGENYARIWMCPWWSGLETDSNSLTRYRLDRAWQLDYVLGLAEQRGIRLLFCLDYHGMFEVTPDYWGGNNYWPLNPYNRTNGGPCVNQDAFFTNGAAKATYQKRLRYLVARYGYSPNVAAWQFFNEIDNVYAYLNANDVAAWHGVMGAWLRTNDPFHHLITTSLTGGSDRPEIWSLPQLDVAMYHSYGEAGPVNRFNMVAQSFLQRYQKPLLIDEFGTDWRGWNRANDPFLRGFRQGLWGGALGGSAGTAMSWWWETIHLENDYPVYSALGNILSPTGWGRGTWTNIGFKTSGNPPVAVGNVSANGQPFNVTLTLGSQWGAMPPGALAVPDPSAADYAASSFNAFFQNTAHPELRVPFRINAWFTNNARLVMHLNSDSSGAIIVAKADGVELYRTNLPNRDGYWTVTNEYNIDIPVNLPAGKRLIEITNAGADWFYLDWVRLEQVLPSTYSPPWQPSPIAVGLRGSRESLLYVVAPGMSFPAGATNSQPQVQQDQAVLLTNWPSGLYYADWFDPATTIPRGRTETITTNGILALPLPSFTEDLAAVVYAPPRLTAPLPAQPGVMTFSLISETGGQYIIEQSSDLIHWTAAQNVTNVLGTLNLSVSTTNAASFFRARRN